MKKGCILALMIICSLLLIVANIVCTLNIITSTCAPWEKVIAIFIVLACTNVMGLHCLNSFYDLY